MNSYSEITPIEKRIAAQRQSAKRHYGVHPYFTRRPYNVVRDYILHYSREGDCVIDPFGGSGVTAIEAFLENRIGIQNDINPLANYIAQGIANLAKGEVRTYKAALILLEQTCRTRLEEIHGMDEKRLAEVQRTVSLPENVQLPSNSDVANYHDLFTTRQLVSLALLRDEIEKVTNEHARNGMLLAWSATLTKLNRTFLSARGRAESRGGSSIFSIYRYKIAEDPVELPAWKTFKERALNIIVAKAEIDKAIQLKAATGGWTGTFETHALDIEDFSEKHGESADYIFTDPPYGGHISYLDLSTLWNTWLGHKLSSKLSEKELIVGGELKHSEEKYIARLGSSIAACVKMLKTGRWLSVVFQHWNVDYFEAILSAATDEGAEFKAAVSQVGDPIWSMHKKKNKHSVLAGELILTFYKSGDATHSKMGSGYDLEEAVHTILSRHESGRMFGESLFNEVVIDAWVNSAIKSINITKHEFSQLIEKHGWYYDPNNHYWIKKDTSPKSLFEHS